ncbi:intradiol ring-cleavage dioxygenase [Nakamurella flava]|uniref:Intradiol ring-cleavage dioxygenase n=1 Tax=Nakamurella flava TaxID=2576308 RepID=A0A4U6QBD3_9ACTN|nr:intradiol ring-cleavage dioxygenase [Nakamurella flava]TKV57291.1 intradiol ring-cleavage dioxygenase [Nakamurella flava]
MTTRPTYQGRTLPFPDEEVVDQGLQFDLGTLLGRRRLLKVMGLGAVGVGLAACGGGASGSASAASTTAASSAATGTLTEIPDETNGPYPADGTNGPDILEQSGVVRSDIRSSFGTSTTTAEGIPMTLRLTVFNLEGGQTPYAGAAVYVWHCNRAGEYSMYSSGLENENYLRGVQIADASGVVEFTSIFPACYSGRWPHVHFEVYPDEAGITDHDNAVSTSQLAFPQDVCDTVYATSGYEQSVANLAQLSLSTDNVFSDDSAAHQLATVTGDVTKGYVVSLDVGVDAGTAQTGGSAPGGSGGQGGMGAPPSGMGAPPSR